MGWTNPISHSPGDVFLSADWNTYVRDNLNSLRHLIYIKDTVTDVQNSTSATDLLGNEVVVPAGAMGLHGAIFVILLGDYLGNSGSPTLTLDIALGGTTLWKDTSSAFTADADRRPVDIEFTIGASAATNSQFMAGTIRIGSAQAPTTGKGGFGGTAISVPIATNGKTAIDMTVAQTLTIKATHSVQDAAVSIRTEYATIWVNP